MKQTERVPVMLTASELEALKRLADANTSGNKSELIRSLVRRASMMPTEFGLIDPNVFQIALAQIVATRATNNKN